MNDAPAFEESTNADLRPSLLNPSFRRPRRSKKKSKKNLEYAFGICYYMAVK